MANTRINYDEARTKKALQQATDPGRWILNVPGNGIDMPYMADPHIIPQKWAGNLRTNVVDLESSLRGVNRQLGRDCIGKDNFEEYIVPSSSISYPVSTVLTTEQSRATHPVWWYRDVDQPHWEYPPIQPQRNVCLPFQSNVSTRILEKDVFTQKRDCVWNETQQDLPVSYTLIRGGYVGGPTLCTQSNSCSQI